MEEELSLVQMEEEPESLEAILIGLVEIGQPQLCPASATIRREGLQSADLLSYDRASQDVDVQSKQTAASLRCSPVLSGSTEMRLIASTSVGPFTALMPNLNDMQ